MKSLLLIFLLMFSCSICNLTSKLKEGGNSNKQATNAPGGTGSSGSVERAEPSAAQTAALAGGKEVKWDQQGMTFTVPQKWTESTNESKTLVWTSPGYSANLIVSISPMAEDFPTETSINAFYDGAKTRAKNGEVDEVKWVEIDGLKGLQFRESNPEKPDDQRRLQWMAYRKYAGQVQLVNLMLASRARDFARQQDAMYGILYSTKLVH
jgi:hypothetical protein